MGDEAVADPRRYSARARGHERVAVSVLTIIDGIQKSTPSALVGKVENDNSKVGSFAF